MELMKGKQLSKYVWKFCKVAHISKTMSWSFKNPLIRADVKIPFFSYKVYLKCINSLKSWTAQTTGVHCFLPNIM